MQTLITSCECPRCGQTSATIGEVCDSCRAADRQPQGEAVRLFAPAPAVMPGQMELS